jgi:CheY-like chemotaxis protein
MPGLNGNVMIVDDNAANLALLEEMLSQHGCEVRSFPRGRLALAAAEHEPPDVILLDINMPEMDGYQMCRQLKSRPHLAAIPVIFLSALSATEDKIEGFRAGGVDYISKPFQFEEVQARVEIHVQLRRARQTEQDLLERTLGGAVETLWELVQLAAPRLAARSRALRDIVVTLAVQMQMDGQWQYELAANLCLAGCLTLPERIFDLAYAGQSLSTEEERMYRAHPETGARLLRKIPRLESVADMVRCQHNPWASAISDKAQQGAVLLYLAQEFDRRLCRGMARQTALAEIRSSRHFEPELLNALDRYLPSQPDFESRRVRTRELGTGMILDQDVLSNGLLILKEGTVLTETWIERVTNFVRASGTADLVSVRVPRAGAAFNSTRGRP